MTHGHITQGHMEDWTNTSTAELLGLIETLGTGPDEEESAGLTSALDEIRRRVDQLRAEVVRLGHAAKEATEAESYYRAKLAEQEAVTYTKIRDVLERSCADRSCANCGYWECRVWTEEWPTNPGFYWFHGFTHYVNEVNPFTFMHGPQDMRTCFVRVRRTGNGRYSYGTEGRFLYKAEARGYWTPATLPRPERR